MPNYFIVRVIIYTQSFIYLHACTYLRVRTFTLAHTSVTKGLKSHALFGPLPLLRTINSRNLVATLYMQVHVSSHEVLADLASLTRYSLRKYMTRPADQPGVGAHTYAHPLCGIHPVDPTTKLLALCL